MEFIRNNKGSVSLFILIVLLPVMLFTGIIADFARISLARAQTASMAQTYANSYLSLYDETLNEIFGLFAVSQHISEEEQAELKEYILTTVSPKIREYTHSSGTKVTNLFDRDDSEAIAPMLTMINKDDKAKTLDLLNAELTGSLDDNDALMMQIAEYIKLIGPADLTINLSQDLLNKLQGETEDSQSNYDILKEKKKLDDSLDELSNSISAFGTAMDKYETEVEKTFNGLTSYASQIKDTYYSTHDKLKRMFRKNGSVYKIIANTVGEFVETYSSIEYRYSDGSSLTYDEIDMSTVTTPGGRLKFIVSNRYRDGVWSYDSTEKSYFTQIKEAYNAFSDMKEITKMVNENNSDGLHGSYDDGSKIGRFIPITLNKYKDCGRGGDTCSNDFYCIKHLCTLRDDVCTKARAIETAKASISQKIQNMENKANEAGASDYSKKLVEGIKKDYGAVNKDAIEDPNTDIGKIMKYDFNKFADWFAAEGTNKIINSSYAESPIFKELSEAMDNIRNEHDERLYKALKYANSLRGNYYSNNIGEVNVEGFKAEVAYLTGKKFEAKEMHFEYLSDEYYCYDWTDAPTSADALNYDEKQFNDYYTLCSENSAKVSGTEISIMEMYEVVKKWGQEKDSEVKDLAESLTDTITKTLKSLMDTSVEPRCSRTMPSGTDEAAEKTIDLTKILEDENSSSLPSSQSSSGELSAFESYINKLLLVMYAYDTFTCHTSDKEYNKESKQVDVVQPESIQGIKQAKTLNKKKDGFTESETNYLLFAEMEYIFGGNKSAENNFAKVRNSLAVIRFVPNYISTYTIDEINNLMLNIQAALSFCPPAAIVAVQLLRVAIAALETFCDLNMLYDGKPVLLYKDSINNLSFIQELNDAAMDSLNNLSKTAAEHASDETGSSKPSNTFTQMKQNDQDDGIKVTYDQYLLLLTVIFVNKQTLLDRTADLIEVNMSYIEADGSVKKDENGKELPIELTWTCAKAFTGVKTQSSIYTDFLFMDQIYNLSSNEELNAEIDAMSAEDNKYTYTVQLSY